MNNIITIVTPSLNQGQFLEQAILSVVSQAGPFSIDYIIEDGGSTDQSLEIIKKYDEIIKRKQLTIKCRGIKYRWRSGKDSGQANAINRGLMIADGDILAWLNSDDYYQIDCFSKVIKFFSEHQGIDLLYGNCIEVNQITGKVTPMEVIEGDYNKFLVEGLVLPQPATFFTRNIFEQVGKISEEMHHSFDYDFFLRIAKKGAVKYIPEDLAFFRLWPESKTFKQKEKFLRDEKIIRKKFGGSLINPISIHRLRLKFPLLEQIKIKTPAVYYMFKRIVYWINSLFHY